MSELIDREALLDECLNHYEVGNIEQNCTMDWICKTVRNFPAAPRWVRCEERLPDEKCDLLFVLHYDAYHDTGFDEDMPANTKVVYGRFEPTNKRGRRYWTWETESGLQECISNERDEDEYGCITLVTHWMPLPEPPKEDMDGKRREG